MAELFQEIVGLFDEQPSIRVLAERCGVDDPARAGRAVVLGVPIIIDALCRHLADPHLSGRFLEVLAAVERAGVGDPVQALRDGLGGSEVVALALGPARLRVASIIADEVGLAPGAVDRLLPIGGWAVATSLVGRKSVAVGRRTVMAELDRARRSLIDGGWGAWLAAAAPARPAPARPPETPRRPGPLHPPGGPLRPPSALRPADPIRSGPPAPAARWSQGAPSPSSGGPYPPPVARRSRLVDLGPAPDTGLDPDAGFDPDDDLDPDELIAPLLRWPTYAGVLLLFLVGAGGLLWLLGERNDGIDAVGEETADAASVDSEPPLYSDPGADFDEAGGQAGSVAIDVEMADPTGVSASTGLAELRFDLDEGELCYNITTEGIDSPYAGHIHVGPAGVEGGIVIDFGPLANREIDCLPLGRQAMEPILADLDGHYVELHDPRESFTIRAQLSEGTVVGGSPAAGALSVDLSAGTEGDDSGENGFDPEGDGAVAVIEEGRIVLQGPVADRATADRLLDDFSGVDGLAVVDELTLVAGALAPTGRIRIDNSVLFAVDSDRLAGAAFPVVADLAVLLRARPGWSATVVGHTDSSGDEVGNLELSLRRAEAVLDELVDNGVPGSRLSVEGAGSTRPIGDNATVEGRARNRRIEIEISRTRS